LPCNPYAFQTGGEDGLPLPYRNQGKNPTGQTRKEASPVDCDKRLRLEFRDLTEMRHARYVASQLTEVAVPRELFAAIPVRIQRLGLRPSS